MNQILKQKVKDRDKVCVICGGSDNLTVDHKLPLSEGGTDDLENLQTMCQPCNHQKDAVPPFWNRIKNLFNGNFYHFKTEIRKVQQQTFSQFNQLKKDLEDKLSQKFGDINSRFGSLEATNKILIEKIAKLERTSLEDNGLLGQQVLLIGELNTKIKALADYHKLEWTVENKYKKVKKSKS